VLGLASTCVLGIACGDDDDDSRDDAGAGGNTDAGGGAGGRSGAGGSAGTSGGGSGSAGTGGSSGSGGTSSEDDGGVDEDAGADATALRDLTLELIGYDPHVGQLMHFRVVSDDDALVAVGVWDPLQDADTEIALPGSTPNGVHRLDYFADLDGSGGYNPPPADHAWRMPIPANGDVSLAHTHDTDFTNIAMPSLAAGEDLTFSATDMDPHVGQLFEVRVFDEDTGQLRGRYVLAEIETADFEVVLPGIIQDGSRYPALTVSPDFSALVAEPEPGRSATTTSTPESFRLLAWAWPCEP
jgi:hypothetical protein